MKTIFKKIIGILDWILVIAIFAMILFVFFCNKTGQPVFIGDQTVMWVLSPSMEPEIPAQSYLLVKKTAAEDIKEGDVIVFYSDDPAISGQKNTHRVVEIIGDHREFVTKGDNNPVNDVYTAKAEKVIGIYIKTLPFLSAVGRFLATKIGMIIAATLIFAMIFLLYLPEMRKAVKQWNEMLKNEKKARIDKLVQEEVERLNAQNGNRVHENPISDATEENPH